MREPEKVNWVLSRVLFVYVSLISVFSAIVYYCFGEDLKDMVTLNLPSDALSSTLQIVYSIGLLGSYPLQMLPVFQIVESTVLFKRVKLKLDHKTWIWRSFCVVLTALIAMGVP